MNARCRSLQIRLPLEQALSAIKQRPVLVEDHRSKANIFQLSTYENDSGRKSPLACIGCWNLKVVQGSRWYGALMMGQVDRSVKKYKLWTKT